MMGLAKACKLYWKLRPFYRLVLTGEGWAVRWDPKDRLCGCKLSFAAFRRYVLCEGRIG